MIRSIRALQRLSTKRGPTPKEVIGTVLRGWSKGLCPELPPTRWGMNLALADHAEVRRFESKLLRLPLREAAYWLSTVYTALSPKDYRKRMAMYFTPPPIANRLLDDLADEGAQFGHDSFMDPACGGAAFLTLVADRMRSALLGKRKTAREILRHAETHLAGYDLDETLCALARQFLRMVFYPEIRKAGRAPDFNIKRGDSLTKLKFLQGKYDVVVCNPPYRKLSQTEVEPYRESFSEVIQGQPNLYALFIQLATKLTKNKGLVGLVTPTSFLSGQSFEYLRTYLLKNSDVKHIGIIRERVRVYLDVEQDTALTLIQPGASAGREDAMARVSVVERDGQYKRIGCCPLPNSGTSWPLARDPVDLELLKKAAKSAFRLEDYGYTPTIGAFVWNRDTRPTYLTYERIPDTRVADSYPLLWASDLASNGRLLFKTHEAEKLQSRYVYLGRAGQNIVKKKPAVLLQRVTASDQAIRLVGATVSERFISEHGGYIGENHIVILEQAAEAALSPTEMLALLKTPVINRYFTCISGCANVSIFELQQLPLPDPEELKRLLADEIPMGKAAEQVLVGSGS